MNSLSRREGVPRVLLAAVKGEEIVCTKLNAEDVVHCIRIVSHSLLSSALFPNSVCWKGTNDSYNDMGGKTWMESLQRFTTAFFDEHTLLYRLLKPLHSFISFIETIDPAYLQTKGPFVTILRNDKFDEVTGSTAAAGEREEERGLGTRTMTAKDVVAEELKKLGKEYMSSVIRSGKFWAHSFRYETSDYDADRRQEMFKMFNILFEGELELHNNMREIDSIRCAVVSGNYYPRREQVLLLPFNSEQCSFDNSEKLSPCSKSF